MTPQTTLEDRFGKCPYATAQSLISGKWAVLILMYLEDGPVRFNELLRNKQYDGIPAKVEYSLTEIGRKFHPVIAAMETWGNEYIAQMQGEREA